LLGQSSLDPWTELPQKPARSASYLKIALRSPKARIFRGALQRRTAAIKFFINFRLLHLRTTLNEKLSFAERLLTYNDLHEGGISRKNQQYGFMISSIEHVPLLSENEWKVEIGWGDLALLDQTTQYAIRTVTTSVV
jgi:hypothetical protein